MWHTLARFADGSTSGVSSEGSALGHRITKCAFTSLTKFARTVSAFPIKDIDVKIMPKYLSNTKMELMPEQLR